MAVLAMAALSVRVVAAGVRSVDLTVSGTGATYGDAVNDALIEAIAQKTGRAISTQTQLKSVVSSVTTSSSQDAIAREALARQIQTATNGEVLGYEVLEQNTDEHGLVRVKLQVHMADIVRSAQSDRIRIAVTKVRAAIADQSMAEQIEVAAKSALADTRKFAVLDRDWEKEYSQEMALLADGTAPREEKARIGQRLGTDLLLIIAVQQVRITVPDENSGLLDAVGSANCNFTVVDAATGQVKIARTFAAKINKVQAKQIGVGIGTEQIAMALANSIGRKVSEFVIDAAYPVLVVSTDSEEIVLNQGGERIKVGQAYEVFAVGDMVVDLQTGENLGRAERSIGRAVVTRVTPKMSYAKIEQAKGEISSGMVLRRVNNEASNKEPTANPGGKNDKDW